MTAPASTTLEETPIARPRPAPALPRLLAGIPAHGAMSLDRHLDVHGPAPGARDRRRARGSSSALIEEIERAGLRGRGGAAFPTATKMRAVASERRRAIVVANGVEAEPASLKDRTLLATLPHLVLDGGILAAEAIGADELIICLSESDVVGIESVSRAIDEREHDGAGGWPVALLRSDRDPRLRLASAPARYLAGQETALIAHLNGRPAAPTFTPPMPFEAGVSRRPTLVNNVETLAQIGLIARHGSRWFRELGTPGQPGSTLITLSGPVAHPGVYEIEQGASLSSLVHAAGGSTARPRAALFGGYAGGWIGTERLHGLALSDEHLAPHGASLGAGVVVLLGEDACPVAETIRAARWLAGESAGQCGPCVHGLAALARTVSEIAGDDAGAEPRERVARLASLIRRRGACSHPDGSVRFILSALDVFAAEFADHARHGSCDACARGAVLAPSHSPARTSAPADPPAIP